MSRTIKGVLPAVTLPAVVLPVLLLMFYIIVRDEAVTGRLALLVMLEFWIWGLAGAVYALVYDRLPGVTGRAKGVRFGVVLGVLVGLFFAPLVLQQVQGPLAIASFNLMWGAAIILLPLLYAALWQVVGAVFDTLQPRSA